MIYVFPAVFEYNEEDEAFEVDFPDIEGCFTCGYTVKEAVEMAEDVLNLVLWDKEYNGEDIPIPSDIKDLRKPIHEKGFLSYILADTEAYSAVMVRENPQMHFDLSRIKKESKAV